jgi:lysophospholipase
LETAPYRSDLAEGPDKARAVWVTASDEARLRIAFWPADRARGTILIFPGRTEYIEKYGRVARDLTAAGYTAACIDWRGQGFSDRLADDRLLGHVLHFQDYQKDVSALLDAARALQLPEPLFLLAHSMGGCIGYRALAQGLPVARAVFTAPMWGIRMTARQRSAAAVLPGLARLAGQQNRYTPGNRPVVFDPETGFAANPLTGDPDHFAYMSRQLKAEEQFVLSGPSLHWLGEALRECRALRGLPRPDLAVLTFLGTDETVVEPRDVERMHAGWPGAELRVIEGAHHELMMETPEIRGRVLDQTLAFLNGDRPG